MESGASRRRYHPIAQIGRGGMAEVLLAMVDAGGGVWRLEVLKKIWPEMAADPDFVTMFLDEARLSLRLNHANVVRTHEVVVGDGELAIAMEYLDGQPLTRVLNRLLRGPGDLSLALRLRILTCVLAGLEHAHTLNDFDGSRLGVVHRDVSPQNVFITYDGQVKLVDFGVAKTLAASHHTRPGAIKGKLAYMAPEQLQCENVDRRADIFAVGVMLWEMLAARRMWHGKTEVEIVGHLASGRPLPPLPIPPDGSLPAGLDAICARALDPDPERRYQTAAEMEIELEGVLVGVADSHARNLGKVVSLAFASERAERHALIERHAHHGPQAPGEPASLPVSLPPIDVPVDDLDDQDDVTLAYLLPAELDASTAVRWRGAPAAAPTTAWWRGATAFCGLVALVTTTLLAVGWRRAAALEAEATKSATASTMAAIAPRASDVAAAPAPALAPPSDPPVAPARTTEAAPPAAPGERRHHHRRHRAGSSEDNATLPPSEDRVSPNVLP